MLAVTMKPCRIGPSINTRTEYHGEEQVPAMDIPLADITLSKDELEELLGLGRWECLFFLRKGDDYPLPFLDCLKTLAFKHKFENAEVALLLGLNRTRLALPHVKLSKIKLDPMPGGLTSMQLTVHCTPEMDKSTSEKALSLLFAFLDQEVEVDIAFGNVEEDDDASQAELGLTAPSGKSVAVDVNQMAKIDEDPITYDEQDLLRAQRESKGKRKAKDAAPLN